MMHFFYSPKKAAQAAAQLVKLNGNRMDMYALIKILYLADRAALIQRGRPITGDAMVSMPYGPVLSRIYDEASSPAEIQGEFWREYLAPRENNTVALKLENPPSDELSDYERETIRATNESLHNYGFSQLKRITHELPEYVDPQGSSQPIDPAEILRNEGWTEQEIQDARMSARQELFLAAQCA